LGDHEKLDLVGHLISTDDRYENLLGMYLLNRVEKDVSTFSRVVSSLLTSEALAQLTVDTLSRRMVIESITYFRFNKGIPDEATLSLISELLSSPSPGVRRNVVMYFRTHLDKCKSFIDRSVISELASDPEHEIKAIA
jgi:hypothetical protein